MTVSSFTVMKNGYHFDCVEIKSSGSLVLSTVKHKNERAVIKEAVRLVLFSGFQSKECGLKDPLLKGSDQKRKFSPLEKAFFSKNGDYKRYGQLHTSESNQIVEINYYSLKQYLTEKKIILPLSNGF